MIPSSPPSLPPASEAPRESLLVFSDVHLGSDLNDRGVSAKRSLGVDRDLVDLLRYYANVQPRGERWRVVIAGDLIDFIGMTLVEDETRLSTDLTEEERAHGLGSAPDHARVKLRRVIERHGDVFDALAQVLARGHALTVVHGNHDVELHWDEVKADFRDELVRRACLEFPDVDATSIASRVDFEPWFFYREGVAYIEHGHQYDAYCANDHVMAPLSPLDPRRLMRGFSSILLRYVVRPTAGMKEHGHETMGVFDYIGFGLALGTRGIAQLLSRFVRAIVELFRLRKAHLSEAFEALKEEHERRLARFSKRRRIGIGRLRKLLALQVPPVTRTVQGILGSLFLDRIGLVLLTALVLAVVAIFVPGKGPMAGAASATLLVSLGFHRYFARLRKLDPADEMVARARHLVNVLPAAFVVMGHTHVPADRELAGSRARYINLGSWAEEEHDASTEHPYRAARTHLVIEVDRGGVPMAELRAWSEAHGPRKFESPSPEGFADDRPLSPPLA